VVLKMALLLLLLVLMLVLVLEGLTGTDYAESIVGRISNRYI
jgi:hypothetical protein